MHFLLSTAAIIGLAAAAPLAPQSGSSASHSGDSASFTSYSATPSYSTKPSYSTASSSPKASSSSSSQEGFRFPLSNGFPNPNDQALKEIEEQAFGTLPNTPPPPKIAPDSITNLQLVAFNELFEVAYFTDLLYNITNNVTGYEVHGSVSRDFLIETLLAVQAQEELHLLNANGALQHFGQEPILPCTYVFPVDNLNDAIALAATFTDVVLGTLQDVIQDFAQNGDAGFTRGVASVVGQEGEQEGFYRLFQGKRPNELPFLTTSVRDFAFSALQAFVVPGSCPNENLIKLNIFTPLNVETKNIQPKDQTLRFDFTLKDKTSYDSNSLSLVYINQQNLPIVEEIKIVSVNNGVVTFDAFFPFEENELNGLTIAAVTSSKGPFANANEVAKATIAAPGLIEVD